MYIFNKYNLLNFLICFIPLSLILGNLALNINIILICLLGIHTYKKELFLINNNLFYYLIYIFFFYLIFITLINNYTKFERSELYLTNFYKSLFFLRYLFLFLIVNKLLENKQLNIKMFFLSSGFLSAFLTIDIIIQIIFGVDLVGYEITKYRPSGFFGEENIAGSYLQKFIIFFIFYFFIDHQNKKTIFYILILFLIFLIAIFLTGNRMPFLLYIGSILIFFLLQKKFKQIIFTIFFITLLVSYSIKFPLIERIDLQIKNFFNSSIEIITKAPKVFANNDIRIHFGTSGYLTHFNSGVQIWKKNKFFGHGLKSFPLNCKYSINQTCNTHPHNYFIELLVDTGIIGLFLIYFIFFVGLIKYTKYFFSFKKKLNKEILLSFPFFIIIFFEFFPIRSTGSFFTTSNSSIIFFFLAIFLNVEKISLNYKK